MKPPPLEESIRKESEEAISAIREKEAAEIREMNEACAAEIEEFKEKAEAEARARIEQERSRLGNKALLERRKFKLCGLDAFIGRMVKEAAGIIRDDPRYKTFLLDRVREAAGAVQGGIEVSLHKEDLSLEGEIVAAVGKAGRNPDVAVREDPAIRWGGCAVRDGSEGRIFNSTIERIYYRNAAAIRREITKILSERGFSF